jgi:hypothetical protein
MMMQDFVAYPSKWRLALLLLATIVFVVIGLWMIGLFGPPPDTGRGDTAFVTFFGWASVIFFGFCLIVLIRMMFDSGEQVRINQRGIYWKRWSTDTIPWSEVTDVSVWEMQRQKCIILNLLHADRYTSTTLMGRLAGANRRLTGGDIAITLSGTDGRFADAMAAIKHFRAKAKR